MLDIELNNSRSNNKTGIRQMTLSQRSGDTSHCQLFTNKTKNEIDLPN